MKKIFEITEENMTLKKYKKRVTVRAVILNDRNEVLMLYSKMFKDYTFPGGGLAKFESKIKALKRELKEEIGATNIEIIKKIGYAIEYKFGINSTIKAYKQKSFYYQVEVVSFGTKQMMQYEKQQGLIMKWVTLDWAISNNDKVNLATRKPGMKTVLKRENAVLLYLRGKRNAQI